jgi:hypothetical protein
VTELLGASSASSGMGFVVWPDEQGGGEGLVEGIHGPGGGDAALGCDSFVFKRNSVSNFGSPALSSIFLCFFFLLFFCSLGASCGGRTSLLLCAAS